MGNPLSGEDRKAATAAYKERKVVAGIYLVRCTATGQAWVGQWPNVTNIENRIWFTLRQGSHPNRDLQTAWQQHGAAHFQFEILERMDAEETTYIRDALLKDRAAHWRSTLDARPI